MHAHDWPGNVRELQHTLLRAAIWSPGESIDAREVESAIFQVRRISDAVLDQPISQGIELQQLLDRVARHYMERALDHTGHRKAAAAKLLGFSNHQTLLNWEKRLGVGKGESDD